MRSEVADLQATFTTGACKFSQLTHDHNNRNNETINQLVDQHTITQFTYSKIQYVLVIYQTKLVPVSKM